MASRALVVGSGIIGLRTAVELLRRNVRVVLRSPRHPLHPSTCSQGAGGLWLPFHCDHPRTDRWALETLDEIHPMGMDPANKLVERVRTIVLHQKHTGPLTDDFMAQDYNLGKGGNSPLPSWSSDKRLDFQHLSVEMLAWQNIVYKLKIPSEQILKDAGYLHGWLFHSPTMDCPAMLANLLEEVEKDADDVNVETGIEYESMDHIVDDAKQLDCDAIVNCTGLGASKLCNDPELIGARGVMLHYDRETCIRNESMFDTEYGSMIHDATILTEDSPWGSETMPAYMIVRGNKIVVGGSYLEGDKETTIRDTERVKLLETAQKLGIDIDQCEPIDEWTGFRPYRSTARCEIDQTYSDVKVVHSYGYGGSGWTVHVGTAKEAASLLLDA